MHLKIVNLQQIYNPYVNFSLSYYLANQSEQNK